MNCILPFSKAIIVFIVTHFFLVAPLSLDAQVHKDLPWHLQAYEVDEMPGIALPQALELLAERQPKQKVKVAILDSGIETDHLAFKNAIHTNLHEIPGNGIDDDKNGYVDDVCGWNFLVDSLGQNLKYARYESAYIKHLHDSLTKSSLPLPDWLQSLDMELVEEKFNEMLEYQETCSLWAEIYMDLARPYFDVKQRYPESFEQIWYMRRDINLNRWDRRMLKNICKDELRLDDIEGYVYDSFYLEDYWLNPYFNPRQVDEHPTFYGNNRCDEKIEDHGTHVAGIIAGRSFPGSESVGVAAGHVEIIPVRMVTEGVELDKDVANAIRYAVNQGAQIINMSFGKYISTHPDSVRSALEYAADHDVLVVHAAGNEARNIDNFPFYPNPGSKGDVESIFITVGASSNRFDENLLAEFSNYGNDQVDLFAPGVAIISASLNGEFEEHSGTSMAAPVVAGIAALLRAYFPEFSAAEIKNIIMNSVYEPDFKVYEPGNELLFVSQGSSMKKFCKAGGIANARKAVLTALELSAENASETTAME